MAIDLCATIPPIIDGYVFWMNWLSSHDILGHKFSLLKGTRKELYAIGYGSCPACYGTELVASGKHLCLCKMLEYAETKKWAYESSYIPSTINSLKAVDIPPGAQAQTIGIKEFFVDFLEKMEMWLYLYGGYGSGKTHLMYALKSNLRGLAMYVDASDLSAKIFTALGDHTLDALENELEAAPILLVDDFGAEHGSDFLYATLFRIVNRRYALGKLAPTVFTSNLTFDELAMSPNMNMRRIGSRLGDVGLVYHLTTTQADYREVKR